MTKINTGDTTVDRLLKEMVRTGSDYWGLAGWETPGLMGPGTRGSDIDFACDIKQYHLLLAHLKYKEVNIKNSDYFQGFYFEMNNKLYNVFFFQNRELEIFRMASDVFKYMVDTIPEFYESVKEKTKRVAAFESFKAVIKLSLI